MKKRQMARVASLGVLGVFVGATAAQASIVSKTPNTNFTNGGASINLVLPGNFSAGFANYNFKDAGPGGFGDAHYVSVKTGGDARLAVSRLSGKPSAYFTDSSRAPFIDSNLLTDYQAVDSYTKIPFSIRDSYLGLALDFDDGRHYGYARIAGPNLLSYGFQTDPGVGIQAGATAPASNPVPGPGSLGALGFALALIGFGTTALRRRKS